MRDVTRADYVIYIIRDNAEPYLEGLNSRFLPDDLLQLLKRCGVLGEPRRAALFAESRSAAPCPG
jgi:hypothetical protein